MQICGLHCCRGVLIAGLAVGAVTLLQGARLDAFMNNPSQQAAAPQAQNELTAAEKAAGWRLLFDGKSLNGWREYKADSVPTGWKVTDGLLTKDAATRDILTKEQFGNFELSFDWRIGRGGNAGLMYRVTEEYDHPYWTGPEYQLLDDPNARDGRSRLTAAASGYALYPAAEGALKPFGEWNTSRIVVNGAKVEHFLNGQKVVEYEFWSPDWEEKVKASKFKDWPNYGRAKAGHIAIQGDHGGALALRNMKIRTLP